MAAFCSCIAAQRALLAAGRRSLATTLHTRMLYTVGNTACQRLALQTAASSSSHVPLHRACAVQLVSSSTHYSTSPAPKASSTERIKVVLKEYGGVGVVFHTVMSLCSLGTCYLIVSRSEVIRLSSIPIPSFTVTPIPHTVVLMWAKCWNTSTYSLRPPPKVLRPLPSRTYCTRCSSPCEPASPWPPYLSSSAGCGPRGG